MKRNRLLNNKSFIDNIGFVLPLPFFIDREEVKVHKKGKKNEANVQSSWSKTHIKKKNFTTILQ